MTTALGANDRLRSSVPLFFCEHISRSGRRRVPSGEVSVETITITGVEFVESGSVTTRSYGGMPYSRYQIRSGLWPDCELADANWIAMDSSR